MLWCCHSLLWILHVPHIFIVYLGVPPHPSCACSGGEWTEEWSSSFCLRDSLLYVMSLTNLQLAIVWCNHHRTILSFFSDCCLQFSWKKPIPLKNFCCSYFGGHRGFHCFCLPLFRKVWWRFCVANGSFCGLLDIFLGCWFWMLHGANGLLYLHISILYW